MTEAHILDQVNKCGFYFSSSTTDEAVKDMVKEGKIKQIDPNWVHPGFESIYIGVNVTDITQLPISMISILKNIKGFVVGETVNFIADVPKYGIFLSIPCSITKVMQGKCMVTIWADRTNACVNNEDLKRQFDPTDIFVSN